MKEDKLYQVVKDIPVNNGKIAKDTWVSRIHGAYYMDGVLVAKDFQEDFDKLIESESKNGWNYIVPIVRKVAYGNDKENLV